MGGGLSFGNLPIRIRRILYHGLSPFEQKAWVKSVSHGIPNLMKRAVEVTPSIAPSVIITALVFWWAHVAHERYVRKDPKMYENDQ